jgi:hypothetical protein
VLVEAASQVVALASPAASLPAAVPASTTAQMQPVQAPAAAPSPAPVLAKAPASSGARIQAAPNATTAQAPGMTVDNAALRPLPPSTTTSASAAHRTSTNSGKTVAAVNERRPPVIPGPTPIESPPAQRAPVESPPRAQATTTERSNDGALTAVPSVGRDPREQCGGRMLLALHKCLVRECVKPQYYDHAECQQVRAIEERARVRSSP